ncbi:hypothetical protein FBY06_1502 [Pseudomonas sp. SJZ085]|nr:hypothetical protein FBX99_1502 [Pseudomonas sp. SJZ074]TWC18910.1 hypothetical protein FBY00_10668 [Pseudomonas sp. SJZ075]TWC29560.1 hypothetical protein FBY06_1502 [Pseudomonas sp. SJZ085]TWC33346.1 hypothetical protein FBY02_10968 [Pseudomonas sp. SJZ078]TWC55896.1 hypothetical protein FBY11_106144 [Pseudomonas sp. SJZ124]TWC91493.1 hypothetical protein FBY09_10668 [Pseudomonas sp. SJZ101]
MWVNKQRSSPVGASQLAIAECQPLTCKLTHCYREQLVPQGIWIQEIVGNPKNARAQAVL